MNAPGIGASPIMPDRIAPLWRRFWREASPLLREPCSHDELQRLEVAARAWHRDVRAALEGRQPSAGKEAA